MPTYPSLESLGTRICVFGPSNSGKSTLAEALSDKLGVPAVHLDQLHHLPNTDWEPRPKAEFEALQRQAIAADAWVMDGNYMGLLHERIVRTTGIILLGTDRWSALLRYVRRTLFEGERVGSLAGAKDSLKLDMIRFIMIEQPRKRTRDIDLLRATGLPMIQFKSLRELRLAYAAWGLQSPIISKS
jgi:adenylate kinase family enzyme